MLELLWELFVKYIVEITSEGMICVPNFMKIGSYSQVVLSVKYIVEIISEGMI